MQHLTIGVFGEKDIIKKLGKQGTVNDIMIYNHGSSGGVFTYAAPNSPDGKLHPLLQCINIMDVPVIVSESISKELAEQIVAIDTFGFEKGFILSKSYDLRKIIKGTSLEKFEWAGDEIELREKLKAVHPHAIREGVWLPIDNYFNVKSVGTVILSVIKGGAIKKHDKLIIQPLGREVVVKGIQSQDKDIDSAIQGMRVGANLKGVESDELKRGYVLCADAIASKSVTLDFTKNKYSKESVEKDSQVYLSIGLQVIAGRVESMKNGIALALEQPVVFFSGQRCMIGSTKQVMPRIIGSGIMK